MSIAIRLLSFTIAVAVALTALPTVTILTADAAWADRKDNRHDDGPGNSENAPGHNRDDNDRPGNSENAPGHNRDDGDRPGNGNVARELGSLNAANASVMALLNADPDSNVGQIEIYRQEATESIAAAQALEAAEADYLAELQGYDGRSSIEIEQEIFALDPEAPGYEDTLAGLQRELDAALDHEDRLRGLEADVAAARDAVNDAGEEESAALLQLTGGDVLSAVAVAELRSLLGL
jgi:hypothetical protein